jgi:hypothetical protein
MITLSNSFHGTECRIRSNAATASEAWDYLLRTASNGADEGDRRRAKATIRRVRAILCGSDTCTCGVVR